MRYRDLGASGVRISEVGIGAFPLSGYSTDAEGRRIGWSGSSDDQAVALIHRAEELGINLDVRHERFSHAGTVAAFRRLPELAFLARGRTMPQAALRFTLDHPGTSCVIAGAKTVAQIEENAAAADVPALTAAELGRALPLVDGLTVPNWAGN